VLIKTEPFFKVGDPAVTDNMANGERLKGRTKGRGKNKIVTNTRRGSALDK
jgi:hypothetical protein